MVRQNQVKVTLKLNSICACGFPVLHVLIPLGTEYEINPETSGNFTLICGGCGAENKVRCIWVKGRDHAEPGFLPKEIFEPFIE